MSWSAQSAKRLYWPLAFFVFSVVFTAVVTPALAYDFHGCKYRGAVLPTVTYNYFSMEQTYKNAFFTAQSEWDADTGTSTSYFTYTSGSDPNINVYDGSYAGDWNARTSWTCYWIGDTYWSDEVTIKFNKNHMDTMTDREKWVTASHELGHAYGLDHVWMSCTISPAVMEQGAEKFSCNGNPPWADDYVGWSLRY